MKLEIEHIVSGKASEMEEKINTSGASDDVKNIMRASTQLVKAIFIMMEEHIRVLYSSNKSLPHHAVFEIIGCCTASMFGKFIDSHRDANLPDETIVDAVTELVNVVLHTSNFKFTVKAIPRETH